MIFPINYPKRDNAFVNTFKIKIKIKIKIKYPIIKDQIKKREKSVEPKVINEYNLQNLKPILGDTCFNEMKSKSK